jgi:lipoprotein-anchoring transpeptidase ErfK/SrfK
VSNLHRAPERLWLLTTLALTVGLAPAPAVRAQFAPALAAEVQQINQAGPPRLTAVVPSARASRAAPDPSLIKAEVLLARAHASPGEADGLPGANLTRAIKAFEQMRGLPVDGRLTGPVWAALTAGQQHPIAAIYTIAPADVAGPLYPAVGDNFVKAAKLPALGYSRPSQMLAERFHMSEGLLAALNPGADFTKPGTQLVVMQPWTPPLPAVDHIEVDKANAQLRAYDAAGVLIASFPTTVGSRERPSPSGVRKVQRVTFNPFYTYDPRKLSWGPKGHGVLTIKPGPENPVGVVWIALNAPGYGIHGAPNPDLIGKTQSHGRVRLTNWDALLLAHAVRPGVVVTFVHQRGGSAVPA